MATNEILHASFKRKSIDLIDSKIIVNIKIPISVPCGQSYSSTLIEICLYQATGRMRIKRALIGEVRSCDTIVSRSVFPAKTSKIKHKFMLLFLMSTVENCGRFKIHVASKIDKR